MLISQEQLIEATRSTRRRLSDDLRKAGVPHYVVNGRVLTTVELLSKGLLDTPAEGIKPDYDALRRIAGKRP